MPKSWDDGKTMAYFKRFGKILEAKIIRDKSDNSHKGCAFLRCMYFHEAELIMKAHKMQKKKDKLMGKKVGNRAGSRFNKHRRRRSESKRGRIRK